MSKKPAFTVTRGPDIPKEVVGIPVEVVDSLPEVATPIFGQIVSIPTVTCDTCRFFRANPNGFCYRYPAAVRKDAGSFCGEHKPR